MRVLEDMHPGHFNTLNQVYFAAGRPQQANRWQAVDAKELRGSIDNAIGAKRGENAVFMADHQDGHGQVIGYYSGQKDSERTVVGEHFQQKTNLAQQAYSFDALHCFPSLLTQINDRHGLYLVQVKGNQPILANDLVFQEQASVSMGCIRTVEKAHGRIEQRKASLYQVEIDCVEPRWRTADIKSMMVIERDVQRCNTGRKSYEKAYYISNMTAHPGNSTELFNAIRGHWG
jgi:hypothetical protein